MGNVARVIRTVSISNTEFDKKAGIDCTPYISYFSYFTFIHCEDDPEMVGVAKDNCRVQIQILQKTAVSEMAVFNLPPVHRDI